MQGSVSPTLRPFRLPIALGAVLITLVGTVTAAGPAQAANTSQTADAAFGAWNAAFYHVKNGVGWYAYDTRDPSNPGARAFWKMAEEMEVVEDAYERTRKPAYRKMIRELFHGMKSLNGPDWGSWNTYYDDIDWATIACVRAYWDTGDIECLHQAEWQFNKMMAGATTGLAPDGSQGLWQTTAHNWKDEASNGPAVIAAMDLADAAPKTGYRATARILGAWYVKNFVTGTGEVLEGWGNGKNGARNGWVHGPLTYEQGIAIGVAMCLYRDSKNPAYLAVARRAADWTRYGHYLTQDNGILKPEYDAQGGDGDVPGCKGILARYICPWARVTKNRSYLDWLRQNAESCWRHRNARGLIWDIWDKDDPYPRMTSWECSSAVSMLENVAAAEQQRR